MTGLEVEPSACTWCGIARRGHGRQFADAAGWHEWVAPSDAQVLARMKARRLALTVAARGALPVPVGSEPGVLCEGPSRIVEAQAAVAGAQRVNARLRGSVDRLTRMLAPTQALREPEGEFHDSLHHPYTTSHDMPETGGAR